eukprot:CAMPEP_0115699784 /NCGR_PEP_ID=MMETSP0272-20121206/67062_1 /TAXON_ID=71861 /ORGANISM="Scrippsiella trochoidea, Strain CCMP3099" /LENGTH=109 /DNA_ID=CAMNT_0003140229 /DNA_START=803 /DNA_END=1129 /DNA_ORIENTATION=+
MRSCASWSEASNTEASVCLSSLEHLRILLQLRVALWCEPLHFQPTPKTAAATANLQRATAHGDNLGNASGSNACKCSCDWIDGVCQRGRQHDRQYALLGAFNNESVVVR